MFPFLKESPGSSQTLLSPGNRRSKHLDKLLSGPRLTHFAFDIRDRKP